MPNANKKVTQEFVRHPYTNKKLLVIDSFVPDHPPACPLCQGVVKQVKIIEPECPGSVRYNILSCSSCEQSTWTILTDPDQQSVA